MEMITCSSSDAPSSEKGAEAFMEMITCSSSDALSSAFMEMITCSSSDAISSDNGAGGIYGDNNVFVF